MTRMKRKIVAGVLGGALVLAWGPLSRAWQRNESSSRCEAGVSAEARAAILGDNAARLFHLPAE